MADPYEAIIGGMTPQQDPKMLANLLRNRNARASLAQLSGDKVLMPFGRGEAETVEGQAKTMGADRMRRDALSSREEQAGLQRALQQKYYDQLGSQHGESMKLRRAQLAASQGNAAAARAQALEIAKLKNKPKALPKHYFDDITESATEVQSLQRLRETQGLAKPGQSSIPGVSTVETYAANNWGIGTDAAKAKADWWNDFQQRWNIAKRNASFGATLSENEKRSWDAATINPEMSEEQIAHHIDLMERSAKHSLTKKARAAIRAGYNPDEVGELMNFSPLGGDPVAPVAGAQAAGTSATGNKVVDGNF